MDLDCSDRRHEVGYFFPWRGFRLEAVRALHDSAPTELRTFARAALVFVVQRR